MSEPMQRPLPEFIVVNGKEIPVSRDDMRTAIRKYVKSENMTNEQAWEKVKADLKHFFEHGKIAKDWGKIGKRGISGSETFEEGSERPDLFLEDDTLTIENNLSAHPAPIQQENKPGFDLSDDLLPEHLRKSGVSVMHAISRGMVKIDGEHPDAELLRASVAESSGIFHPNDNIDNKPSLRQIRERQLAFPFKVPSNVRIMATDFNQTSLFHVASNNTPRRFMNNELMGRVGVNVSIYFHGEELRHDDEATFLQLIHLARGKAPYEWIHADNVPFIRGARGTVRILGAKDSSSIDESLMRMRGAYVVVRNAKRKSFITLNLIRDLQGSGSSRRIMIDPCMVALLESYTTMDQDVLYEMKGVARQLFKYISTIPYAGLFPTKVMSFFELCYGTQESIIKHYRERNPEKTDKQVKTAMVKKISDFRSKTLPQALEELKERELIVEYTIDTKEDKVAIVKSGAPVEQLTYQNQAEESI